MRGFVKIVTLSCISEESQEDTRPGYMSSPPGQESRQLSAREGVPEEDIIREEERVSVTSIESNSTYVRTIDSKDILADINYNDPGAKVQETRV